MILGGADHHEQLRAIQIRPTEFPERAADGVDHAGRHVHRTETAVSRVVGRAELAGEQTGERLHLIAAGEQREFFRIGRADFFEAFFQNSEGLIPTDFLKIIRTALAARLAPQGLGQTPGRILLHDAGRALRTDHTLIKGMIGIALNVTDFAVAQMHIDATTACTHVTGGVLDFDTAGSFGAGAWHHLISEKDQDTRFQPAPAN